MAFGREYKEVKRKVADVSSQLARLTKLCVALSQMAVGEPAPHVKKGDGGYTDWGVVALHGLLEYLDHPYLKLLDTLREMLGMAAKFGLTVEQLPHFMMVCARMQELTMPI